MRDQLSILFLRQSVHAPLLGFSTSVHNGPESDSEPGAGSVSVVEAPAAPSVRAARSARLPSLPRLRSVSGLLAELKLTIARLSSSTFFRLRGICGSTTSWPAAALAAVAACRVSRHLRAFARTSSSALLGNLTNFWASSFAVWSFVDGIYEIEFVGRPVKLKNIFQYFSISYRYNSISFHPHADHCHEDQSPCQEACHEP
jgi:hypothetical protein